MAADPYNALESRITDIIHAGNAVSVLHWDQQVMMPEGGAPARGKSVSVIQSIVHDMITDDETVALLDQLDPGDLAGDQQAVYREAKRMVDRQARVPSELVEELAETTANAHPNWKAAKEHDEFDRFEDDLVRIVELKREYAAAIDPDRDPYAVLVEDYEPYLDIDVIDHNLETLRDELVPIIDDIRTADTSLDDAAFRGDFDEETQLELARDVLDAMGIDWERSRFDLAPHPFVSGNQFDCRITSRFDDGDLYEGLSSTIHEGGHALYNLNIPQEHFGTPLGLPRDLVVHESQSRLWENRIGRSEPFMRWFLPLAASYFDELNDVDPATAYEYVNRVDPSNPIRVNADEVTYHLHIVVRYELERELIRGEIEVDEIPQVWNDKYETYLGRRPNSDAEGCLQDIHWSNGQIGYFPTYSLGSLLAAQLYDAMADDLGDLPSKIEAGAFDQICAWQTDAVHSHGQRYRTDELIERATGEPLSAAYFTEYIREKYGRLYGF